MRMTCAVSAVTIPWLIRERCSFLKTFYQRSVLIYNVRRYIRTAGTIAVSDQSGALSTVRNNQMAAYARDALIANPINCKIKIIMILSIMHSIKIIASLKQRMAVNTEEVILPIVCIIPCISQRP